MIMTIIDRLFGNICIPVDKLRDIVDAMDVNGDGLIQLSEFVSYLKGYKRMVEKTAKSTGTELPKRRH